MKSFGIFALLLGLIGLGLSLSMQVTVTSSDGYSHINNIGLIADRQNYLIISALITLAGAIFIGFGSINSSQESIDANADTYDCPFCAERIKIAAKLCKHCGKTIEHSAVADSNTEAVSDNTQIDPESTSTSINGENLKAEDESSPLFTSAEFLSGLVVLLMFIIIAYVANHAFA